MLSTTQNPKKKNIWWRPPDSKSHPRIDQRFFFFAFDFLAFAFFFANFSPIKLNRQSNLTLPAEYLHFGFEEVC